MIALTHFRDDGAAGTGTGASGADGTFEERAERALAALAARPGYLRGQLARSMDDTGDWLLLTEWESVGAYRRALGNFDVRINATQLLATALDIPGTFEPLLLIEPGATQRRASDRADDDPS